MSAAAKVQAHAPELERSVKRVLDAFNKASAGAAPDISSLRAAARDLAKFAAPPPPVERAEDRLELEGRSVRLRVYSPPGCATETLPGLVYFHGGGLVAGDLDTHDALTASIAAGARCRVVAVDYALAPEARFPAAREDAIAAARAAMDEPGRWRLSPGRVGVGGDSAGGQLAALAARALAQEGRAPWLQFLLCPVMDPLARSPSRRQLARGYLLDEAIMQAYWNAYRAPGLDPGDPRVAPLAHEDFSALPPALIHVAEADPLRDEGESYALALETGRVRVKMTRHAGMIHHFYGLGAVVPAARMALAAAIAELAEEMARLD